MKDRKLLEALNQTGIRVKFGLASILKGCCSNDYLTNYEPLLENVFLPDGEVPLLVVVVGPCRSGTTALSNVLALTGHFSYMQPFKSMGRASLEGGRVKWVIKENSLAFSKETLGVETDIEYFDPVDLLLRRGYPKDKLQVVTILRRPEETLDSWQRLWGSVSEERLIQAYYQTVAIKRRADQKGIPVIPYVPETIRYNDPGEVIARLFAAIGSEELVYHPGLTDWSQGPVFGESGSNVVFFDNPPDRFIQGVKKGRGYVSEMRRPQLTARQQEILSLSGLGMIYDQFRVGCEQCLGVRIGG
ncbi:MAG: hypothetical protein JW991_04850 [Candidatus Pacebacteria bacterium]|nr:hypothetical protein [Candidatus Paceibacterota bacterium]